tara:strand:+ start:138 stop:572 length:435 start_codon:yes stop_codon:yes gene_type:complete
MIIECPNCHKKFNVESSLIPESGRNIQCGSCNHVWFFKLIVDVQSELINTETQNINYEEKVKKNSKIKDKTQIKKQIKSSADTYAFSKILSFLIVGIISFIALIIVLDTFKKPLTNIFPNLELLLFNLVESIKDIFLFFKNLLQ